MTNEPYRTVVPPYHPKGSGTVGTERTAYRTGVFVVRYSGTAV
jgi:hypothetical protein